MLEVQDRSSGPQQHAGMHAQGLAGPNSIASLLRPQVAGRPWKVAADRITICCRIYINPASGLTQLQRDHHPGPYSQTHTAITHKSDGGHGMPHPSGRPRALPTHTLPSNYYMHTQTHVPGTLKGPCLLSSARRLQPRAGDNSTHSCSGRCQHIDQRSSTMLWSHHTSPVSGGQPGAAILNAALVDDDVLGQGTRQTTRDFDAAPGHEIIVPTGSCRCWSGMHMRPACVQPCPHEQEGQGTQQTGQTRGQAQKRDRGNKNGTG